MRYLENVNLNLILCELMLVLKVRKNCKTNRDASNVGLIDPNKEI